MKRKTAKGTASKRLDQPIRNLGDSKAASLIRFSATLLAPHHGESSTRRSTSKPASAGGGWIFLTLPKKASAKLPSRGQTTVEGTLNGSAFRATLEPDGLGGHWLKVDRKMREGAGAHETPALEPGDVVTLEIAPVAADQEPEPKVPPDLRKALAATFPGAKKAREVWADITPIARRDWIQWITSGKRAETRTLRLGKACDMLAKGKRRPCCFDRSGMYGKSLRCPAPHVADDKSSDTRR